MYKHIHMYTVKGKNVNNYKERVRGPSITFSGYKIVLMMLFLKPVRHTQKNGHRFNPNKLNPSDQPNNYYRPLVKKKDGV